MRHKPEYEITKTRYDVERERIKERLDSECPECHYTDIWNGMITDGEYDYYTCRKCGVEWKVLREDYKDRRSRLQKEFLFDLITTGFVVTLGITFIILNLK